jgi:D-arabinose 1-dehydrogenase-like Zn-dependent alcohol dehydrogenase
MDAEFTVYKGSSSGSIVKATTRRVIGKDQVLVHLTHSGVCGTDEHYRHADIVLGHEGVGVVKKIGSDVTNFKVGDRVGFGYFHKACGECEQCLRGLSFMHECC